MKGYRRYILLILALFTALVLLEYYRPKPVDWTKTLSNDDKIPFGTYALFDVLPDIFPKQEVTVVREPVYNYLQNKRIKGNYVFINNTFAVDSLDLNYLLDFVKRGNQVFIAAEGFSSRFADTLHFDLEIQETMHADSTVLLFNDASLPDSYKYPLNNKQKYIVIADSIGHTPLGRNKAGKLNLMQIPFGKGSFTISTVPLAFTNYELLTLDMSEYAATALSYLPVQSVHWDEYQNKGLVGDTSIFRVLMSHEPLTWSYYIALFTIILFLVFQSKRTQRIIPVLDPMRNTTLDFIKVMGDLYFNNSNHKNIALKKIAYFLEHLRIQYHVNTSNLDEELLHILTARSGADRELLVNLFDLIKSSRKSHSIGDQTLMMLNNYLEDFYKQTSIIRPMANS